MRGISLLRHALMPLVLLHGLTGDGHAADDAETCSRGSIDESIEACTRYINSGKASGRDLASAYDSRAISLIIRGQFDRALEDANEAVRLAPDFAALRRTRAKLLLKKGEYNSALADLDEAIRLYPAEVIPYYLRGLAYEAKGETAKAIADFEHGLSLDPKLEEEHYICSDTTLKGIRTQLFDLAARSSATPSYACKEAALAAKQAGEMPTPTPVADPQGETGGTQGGTPQPESAAAEQMAPGPSATADIGAVREVLKKYGLFGRWSVKCGDGEYSATEWVDGAEIQQVFVSEKERLSSTVEQAVEIAPNELLITSLWEFRLMTKLRIEGDRTRWMELTANGVKAVEGGALLHNKAETDWHKRCQTVPSGPGESAPGSVRHIMEKHGALGAWSRDCTKPPSAANQYEVYRPMDERFVQIDVMENPTERVMVYVVDSAAEAGPNELTYTSTSQNREVLRLRIDGNRVRNWEQVRNGIKRIEDGRFSPEKTLETPWSEKCPDTGAG